MRQILFAIGAAVVLSPVGLQQALAAPRPYCLDADRTHFKDCTFYTFQQCLATAYGLGGICYANPEILWQLREGAAQSAAPRTRRRN